MQEAAKMPEQPPCQEQSTGRHISNSGSTSASCSGGTQAYGFTAQRQGTHVTQSCDTVLNVCNAFGYDEFDRLTSRTVNQGTVQNFTYAYDRYGNRWQQNAPQGGPILNITFNPGNNIINTSGFTNDVVGNVSNDTFHTYTYDPDGNLTAVDGGNTARYYYDSLDQRVQIAPTRGTYEFVWDIFGRRVSNWQAGNHLFVESNAYTDSGPIAIRAGGYRDYETQNWVGTERVRTSYSGAVSLSIASLPWADQHTPSGDNGDQHDFAGMDRDLEDSTEHAQYRQYATNLGRWLSPDQYLGSYDFTNPQSFNRYSYALNDPVNYLDPTGLLDCKFAPCDGQPSPNPPACESGDTVCVTSDPGPGPDPDPTGAGGGDGSSGDGPSGDGPSNAPSGAPSSPAEQHTCQEQRILNAIPGSQLTGGETAQGGHEQFNIQVNSSDLTAAGFTPYTTIFGTPNGYHNGSLFLQVHVNGQNGTQLPGGGGILNVQGHIDVFNPAAGYGVGLLLHTIWDLGVGSLFFRHSAALDPGC